MTESGRYVITNAYNQNVAALPIDKQGAPVVAHVPGLYDGTRGESWDVVKLGNGNYKIQNADSPSYFAGCSFNPSERDWVIGKCRPWEWVIKPTKSSRTYTISPSCNRDLVWGMPERENGTPLCMSSVATDRRNQWIFEPVDNPKHTYPPDLGSKHKSPQIKQLTTDRRAWVMLLDDTDTSRLLQDEEHMNVAEDPLTSEGTFSRRGFDLKSFLREYFCW